MLRRIDFRALPIHRHAVPYVVLDGGLVATAYYLAYRLRFDGAGGIPSRHWDLYLRTVSFVVIATLVVFVLFGMYRHWIRYSSQQDYLRIGQAVGVSVLLLVGYIAAVQPKLEYFPPHFVSLTIPIGVLALHGLLMLLFVAGVRYLIHALYERPFRGLRAVKDARRVLIVGAGDGGRLLIREILRNPTLSMRPVGFIDDDPRKQRARIERSLSVLGTTDDLPTVLEDVEPDEVLIAIPSAPGALRGRIVEACRGRNIPVRTMPTVFEILRSEGQLMRQVREVRVEDILGREPVRMEIKHLGQYLAGETVLVTGAGGSIGSELCRQIARIKVSRLILLDHAEDNLFAINRELVEDRHVDCTYPVLADCKEEERIREIFDGLRPTYIFHAAAYKHVGLMESNPVEAIRNNAIATRLMARVAGDTGARSFTLVSTDKAVEATTVMGASKALAEWAIEEADGLYPGTTFASVRFGNVLGSSGSVVTIFRRQISAGGPLTITDPRMTRYFMTIPEAVQLVIRAGSLARGGEIFVLEMGEPVRIVDLAKDMIRLSGLVPEKDIAIQTIGPRHGEKLHERLVNPYETLEPTTASRILRARRKIADPEWIREVFNRMNLYVLQSDTVGLTELVANLSLSRKDPADYEPLDHSNEVAVGVRSAQSMGKTLN